MAFDIYREIAEGAARQPTKHKTMPKIDDITKQKIKDAAKIEDVLSDAGFRLSRRGSRLTCVCPFHDDRSVGSFTVNTRDNFCYCFSCGASADPISFMMRYHNMKYPEALRYLAAMYNIYIDDGPMPKVEKREPRIPLPPREWMVWPMELVKPYMHHTEDNVLLTWMLKLPMNDAHKHNLRNMIELYFVGTSLKGYTKGWTIWPQVDMNMKLRDMKFMAYKPDGHRDKEHNPNWMSSMLARAGQFDADKYESRRCLFGLHLAELFPYAEVCLVESEKTAVICSAFSDPKRKIWMAVGGMQFFKAEMLEPLIENKRNIVVYPDVDGMDKWEEAVKAIGYDRMTMTVHMRTIEDGGLYIPTLDGPKADIADIMIRRMNGVEESETDKAARLLSATPEQARNLAKLMNNLDLKVEMQ